jgi:hypothetical protein
MSVYCYPSHMTDGVVLNQYDLKLYISCLLCQAHAVYRTTQRDISSFKEYVRVLTPMSVPLYIPEKKYEGRL